MGGNSISVQQTELSDQSTADLVRLASAQLTELVRDELRLARTEMVEKGKRAGFGAGLFGAAGVAAFYGVGALIATAILALALLMPAWASALVVAAVLFLAAAVAALVGRGLLRRAVPAMPTEAARNVQEDLRAVTTAIEERNRK